MHSPVVWMTPLFHYVLLITNLSHWTVPIKRGTNIMKEYWHISHKDSTKVLWKSVKIPNMTVPWVGNVLASENIYFTGWFWVSPKIHVRVKIRAVVSCKSCRNSSLVEETRETLNKTRICWECCVCCLVSVEHLFFFPDWDLTVLMVSQLRAPRLDGFLSDRYSMLFLPPPSVPPTHSLSF